MVGSIIFPYLVPPDDTVASESVVGVKLHDYDVMIRYQVHEFTCTKPAEHFVV